VVLLFPSWNKILEIDEENLTAWVQPGVITERLHKAVEARGLFYPPDPGSQRICTIGGNVSQNSGGLRGLKYGVTGDYVMGIEGFLPTGEPFVTGGKCVKDVAGYDLRRLLVGSEGTLGVFTRILLKLIPKPRERRTLLAVYPRAVDAAATVSAIIAARIIPATLEFLDQVTIRCVEDFAHVGLPRDAESLLLMETDGHPAVVADEAEQMADIARRHGASRVDVAATEADAERLRTARRAAFSALARLRPTTILEDVTVPRSELADMVEKVQEITARHNVMVGIFGHAGDGNLHPTVLCDERDADEMHRVHAVLEEIFEEAVARGGTITGEHGVGLSKRPFFERFTSPGSLELTRRVRKAVDPNGILNPGKILTPTVKRESLVV
jgi:glycolate oxidase